MGLGRIYACIPSVRSAERGREGTGMGEMMRSGVLLVVLALCSRASAVALPPPAPRWNTTCMLVFGDSTVDPGNNNRLSTSAKANFPPYGMDFFGHQPTGRFCDGRLAIDFISESLGISTSIQAFLDPDLQPEQLKHGVSFASASSGYDELTAAFASVFSFPKQIEYLMHYKIHLRRLVGPKKAEDIIKNAVIIISAGTNDFMENYDLYSDRSKQFTVPEYEDYLITLMSNYTKEIHRLGATRFLVVGIPPMGCLPIVRTLADSDHCVSKYNDVAISFNSKLVAQLAILKETLGVRTGYVDLYRFVDEAIKNPTKYGFVETSKGCCGSGTIEFGDTCKGQITCKDPSRYIFWDAVHPTQKLGLIIADKVMKGVMKEVLG